MFILLSCNCLKPTTEKSVDATDNVISSCRFKVSFISIGSGIDRDANSKLLHFLDVYEKNKKVKLDFDLKYWGREGERDYCFTLSEVDFNEQKKIISEIKELLSGSKLVRLSENKENKE